MGRRNTRKKQNSTEDLKSKLHEKLRIKKLERLTQFSRDQMVEKLENKLDENKTAKERAVIQKELDILQEIDDKQQNSINNDYAEYTDNSGGGGGLVFPD
jgi:hypothetical protein